MAYWANARTITQHEKSFNKQQSLQVLLATRGIKQHFTSVLRQTATIGLAVKSGQPSALVIKLLAASDEILGVTLVDVNRSSAALLAPQTALSEQARSFLSALSDDVRQLPITDDTWVSDFVVTADYQLVGVAVRITDGDTDGAGSWLLAAINLGQLLDRYVAPMQSGEFGAGYALDGNGLVLYDHEKQIIGQNVLRGLHAGFPSVLDLDRRLISENEGTGEYHFTVKRGGIESRKLIAWNTAHLGARNVIVALSAPDREINGSLAVQRQTLLLAGGLLLLGFIATTSAFVQMRQRLLKQSNDHLAQLVKQRTEELNKELTARRASETRLRDFAEIASDWFWEMDEKLRFTYFSESTEKIAGFGRDSYLGKTRDQIAAEPTATRKWAAHLAEMQAHRPIRDFTYNLTTPSGTPLSVSISGKPVFDSNGNFTGYRGTGSDISEKMIATRAHEQDRLLLQTVIDSLPVPININDAEGRYLFVNKSFEDWYGKTADGVVGRLAEETFDIAPDALAARVKMERDVMEHGHRRSREELKTLADGSQRYVVVTKFPVRDGAGAVVGFGSLCSDITDRRANEVEMQRAKERLETANRAKTEFLAHMSHELRTPLNSVIGFSQIMADELFGPLGSEKYLGYASDIQGSAQHLLEVIDDILDISKIEAGEVRLDESEIYVRDIVQASLRLVQPKFDLKQQALSTKFPPIPPAIKADRRLVRQILVNLLSNSMKFTPDGGQIKISTRMSERGGVVISVSDTGIGIAPEDIQLVLEPFGQARRSPNQAHEGTGLGLSLSKQLVELHGGSLTIDSTVGKGTVVTITFPPERTVH